MVTNFSRISELYVITFTESWGSGAGLGEGTALEEGAFKGAAEVLVGFKKELFSPTSFRTSEIASSFCFFVPAIGGFILSNDYKF